MMKLKLILSAIAFVFTTATFAQAIDADTALKEGNTKAQTAQNWKDSVKSSGAVHQGEKDQLNKDYNSVNKTYQSNRKLTKNQYGTGSLDEKQQAQALKSYNADTAKYRADKESLTKQKRQFDNARADGNVSDAERATMHKKYKADKKAYMQQKNAVNNQKARVKKDSTPNQ